MARVVYSDASGEQRALDIGPAVPEIVVGRHATCGVVIADPTVSRRHCIFRFDGVYYTIEDLKSTSGTLLNGKAISSAKLTSGDTIICGNYTLQFYADGMGPTTSVQRYDKNRRDPGAPQPPATISYNDDRGIPHSVTLDSGRPTITVGRTEDCAVRASDNSVSRHHARIKWSGDHYELVDLESANGTRVGEQFIERLILQDGDMIGCGSLRIHFACRDIPRRAEREIKVAAGRVDARVTAPQPIQQPTAQAPGTAASTVGGQPSLSPAELLLLERDMALSAVAELQSLLAQRDAEITALKNAMEAADAETERIRVELGFLRQGSASRFGPAPSGGIEEAVRVQLRHIQEGLSIVHNELARIGYTAVEFSNVEGLAAVSTSHQVAVWGELAQLTEDLQGVVKTTNSHLIAAERLTET